tara:strand:- start:977 stop:1879 length:903 start_codon:yes stop_codon:yes gene_type:complete
MMKEVSTNHSALMRRATYASVSIALFLIGIKTFAWIATDSLGLQATLIDSILDAVASLISLVAVRHALRPADKEHRFGHGKIECIAALGQSTFIIGSGGWLLFEAIDRFVTPQIITKTTIGIVVMLISIVATAGLLLFQKHVVRQTNSTAIKADAAHYKTDFIINGGVIASLSVNHWLDWIYLDTFVGLIIALYILHTAWKIGSDAFHMLIDRELPDEDRQKISTIALKHEKVLGMHDLRTRSSGKQSFIQLHLEMDGNMSLSAAHAIADDVMIDIAKAFPEADILIHQDPYQLGGSPPK